MADIEGEVVRGEQLPVSQAQPAHQVQVFNPLDAEPVTFKNQLVSRTENYDALAMHLRGILMPDKDFGRIHIASKQKCPKPWDCSPQYQPGHWSDYQLFASGADKVLGTLGLAVSYPGEADYIRAALTGKQIQDVIIKALVLPGPNRAPIAEGMGACNRDEVNGSLNNTIKRACKRARVDAVKRLPSVSALFEPDYLATLAAAARKNGNNSTSARARQVKNSFNAGAVLEVMPIGKKMKGKRFDAMDDGELEWIAENLQDKPDICNAAKREHEKRYPVGPGGIRVSPADEPPASTGIANGPKSTGNQDTDEKWCADFDDYDKWAAEQNPGATNG